MLFGFYPVYAFSFAVFGDNRDGDEVYADILDRVNADPDIVFAVNTGDFVSRGQEAEYKKYLDFIKRSQILIYHVLGNHDGVYGGWKRFTKHFGPSYYSFNHENSHFIVLDNAFKSNFDKKQYNWLIKDLESNNKENTFVFFHKPTFDVTGFYDDHTMTSRSWAEEMMGTFKKYKVDYVFSGHIHGYGRAERDGTVYIITGGAGAPLYLPNYAGGFYHYVKINVDGQTVKDELVKLYD